MFWKPIFLRNKNKDGGEGQAGQSEPEGQQDNTSGATQTEGENSGKQPDAQAEVKFTQVDLDRVAGQSRKDAKKTTEKELLTKLGFKSLDEAQAALDERTKLLQDKMTDGERADQSRKDAEAKAQQAEAARDAALATARERQIESEIVSLAAGRFANPKAVIRLIDRGAIQIDDGGAVTGVQEALDSLASSEPWTLLPKDGKQATPALGRTNGSGTPPGRTDKDRRADYYGAGRAQPFFKGGGASQVTTVEEPAEL